MCGKRYYIDEIKEIKLFIIYIIFVNLYDICTKIFVLNKAAK